MLKWKESPRRKPLILKGVRQCGKTYIMKEFGKKFYNDVAYFNLERNTDARKVFSKDLDPQRILNELSLIHGRTIRSDTLVILDEIQFYYPAITSLKYFQEELPEYHLMCAGSLLGLKLSSRSTKDPDDIRYSFPVGKVEFLQLRPMCFGEYVLAREGELIHNALSGLKPYDEIPESIMSKLETLLNEYLIVGGMPEVVKAWIDTEDMDVVESIQSNILESYESDLAKYSDEKFETISRVWESISKQISEDGDRFRLKEAGGRSSKIDGPVEWLLNANLIHRSWQVNDANIPLNPRGGIYYKLFFCDVGLLRMKAGMPRGTINGYDEASSRFRGALTENFVLTELDYALDKNDDFHYWTNNNGQAEVDFVIVHDGKVIPIEVKSGKVGRIHSLEVYCNRYDPTMAVVTSHKNVRGPHDGGWMFLPLYLVWRIRDYL